MSDPAITDHRAEEHESHPPETPKTRHPVLWIALIVIAIVLVVAIVSGIHARKSDMTDLRRNAASTTALTVTVIRPRPTDGDIEIEIPGDTQAYVDTPIYARADGYLKRWYVDIGGHVAKGQLIAEIETPELDEQLQEAQATLRSAQANLALAKTTSTRYQDLLKTDSVSHQETEQAQADEAARTAALDGATANVHRLQKLQDFEKIYAPFAGIITTRNVDVGDLIQAGTSNPKELFHLASVGKLRVYADVPQMYAADIRSGSKAWLTLKEMPGQKFAGTIARNSGMIDRASRTLRVEVDVDNANGAILPGSYASVHFAFRSHGTLFTLPSSVLMFRSEGLNVVLVRQNHAVLSPVTIAHDNGKTVDISNGVGASDLVVASPPDSIAQGQELRINVDVSDHSGASR